ncbi:MAG: hypothetical protein IMF10_00390 [Proteobacteria bacterium]|nr:hypothetical protein [Pseudomonadota bacterium]
MPKKTSSKPDETLDVLLSMHGEIFLMDDGFWTKFEAYKVEPGEHIPHGIRYSLTLHDKHNTRILGFDNAHSFKPKKRRYGAYKVSWDHKHKREKILPYEYESAGQLLEDFWSDVEQIIKEGEKG